jgi:hypothetical protein
MSTITAPYHKLAHRHNAETLVLVALLIFALAVLIVAAIGTTFSATSAQINEADLLPLVREPVLPAPVPLARDVQPSLAATPPPPSRQWASPVIPLPVPAPAP